MSSPLPPRRIPCLDGFRAIAICLVLLGHLNGSPGFGVWRPLEWLGDYAHLGVRVFFVISGFLITTLLLKEDDRSGKVALGRFYLRRTLRIFPPFYAYIAVVAACQAVGWLVLRPGDLRAAMTYTMNYHRDRAWWLGHTWSLSVEEQFYLVWPFLVMRLKERRAMTVAAAVVVVVPLIRIATLFLTPSTTLGIGETFQSVADALAAGCLLAGFVRSPWGRHPRYLAALASKAFWLVPSSVVVINALPFALGQWAMGETVVNFGIALLLDGWIRVRRDGVYRLLNSGPLVWLGGLSYSLYLWQQPFLRHSESVVFPLSVAIALFVAVLSYHCVEQPSLRLRGRLESWLPQVSTPAQNS